MPIKFDKPKAAKALGALAAALIAIGGVMATCEFTGDDEPEPVEAVDAEPASE